MSDPYIYKKDRACKKCGNAECGSRYESGLDAIRRRCGNCGYDWIEKPLDKQRTC
jgi:hypothetical protein